MKLNMDKKSIEQASMNTKKLSNNMKTNFLGGISGIKVGIGGLAAMIAGSALVGAVHDMNSQFKQTVELADKIETAADSLNISLSEIQRLRYVQIYGDIGEGMITDISKFSRKFAEFQKNLSQNEELANIFNQIGIRQSDNTYDAYRKLVNSLNLTYSKHGDEAMLDIINALSSIGIKINGKNIQFYTKSGDTVFEKSKKEYMADEKKVQKFISSNETEDIQKARDKHKLLQNLHSKTGIEQYLSLMKIEYNKTLTKHTEEVSKGLNNLSKAAEVASEALMRFAGGDIAIGNKFNINIEQKLNQTMNSPKTKNRLNMNRNS